MQPVQSPFRWKKEKWPSQLWRKDKCLIYLNGWTSKKHHYITASIHMILPSFGRPKLFKHSTRIKTEKWRIMSAGLWQLSLPLSSWWLWLQLLPIVLLLSLTHAHTHKHTHSGRINEQTALCNSGNLQMWPLASVSRGSAVLPHPPPPFYTRSASLVREVLLPAAWPQLALCWGRDPGTF